MQMLYGYKIQAIHISTSTDLGEKTKTLITVYETDALSEWANL